MKVLKFGGTSVGTTDSLKNVKKIVESLDEAAVVVVSALGGLTDRLISTAKKASGRDNLYKADIEGIRVRHRNIIEDLVRDNDKNQCFERIDTLLDELSRLYDGVFLIGDLPDKILDQIVSFGERMSSVIISYIIDNARLVDSLEIIKTEKWFKKNIADTKLTTRNIIDLIHPQVGYPIIAGGFISTDRDSGEITNLGRGGSDFTAALIAAALDADTLEIWTDVDGFMTSDPRIIPDAKIIPRMSFVESMELCSFGAKVIYPPTIYPVFHKNISIKILNTFNPDADGTLISDFSQKDLADLGRVRGLSVLKGTAIINIKGEVAKNVASVSSRTFNALAKKGVSVFLMSPPEDSDCFTFALKEDDMVEASGVLHVEFAPEIAKGSIDTIETIDGLSIVAVVGEDIIKAGPVSPRITNSLERASISPVAIAEGSSKTTVTFAVPEDKSNHTLRIIHSLFF